MSTLNEILLLVHLLGMAAIVGGFLAVLKAPRAIPAMVWGARLQLLSGLAMSASPSRSTGRSTTRGSR
ncbi:hypothetical protein ACX31A_14725 [Dermacoccus nishinomiyaensis]